MAQGSVIDEQRFEREYVAQRRMVQAMLRAEFDGVPDHEEIYQEAWTETLEMQARGETIYNLGGLLRTIAWRRARDRLRNESAALLDPTSHVLNNVADSEALPDEQVLLRMEAALVSHVIDSLEPREAAVIKLRFEKKMDSRQIQRALGLSTKNLEKIATQAYGRVGEALAEREPGASEWRRRQRSLLLACETGVASARQRRHARRLVAEDPACRVMLREIRSTLNDVAAILPLPLLVAQASHGRWAQLRLGILDRFGILRDQATELAARVSSHGSSIEQAGAGSAATLGTGLAVKAALICVAVTGTTVVCLTGGVLDPVETPTHAQSPPRRVVREPTPPRVAPVLEPAASQVVHRHPAPAKRKPVAVASAPPPSPAPAGSTEFGPGPVGSSSATSTPAAAPDNGGGEFLP